MDKKVFLEEFGLRIRRLRNAYGLTQKELAVKSGYKSGNSNTTINKIETGKMDVSVTRLLSFAQTFGVPASYLLGEGTGDFDDQQIIKQNALRIMQKKLNENEMKDVIKGVKIMMEENEQEGLSDKQTG